MSFAQMEVFPMRGAFIVAYGLFGYALAVISQLYAIGFVGNLVVPKSVDSGVPGPALTALLINSALITIFALQHSLMARQGFKKWLTKYLPEPFERSTYVVMSSLMFFLLMLAWRPIPIVLWNIENTFGRVILYGFFFFGMMLFAIVFFRIDHSDFFGIKQVYLYWKNKPYTAVPFTIASLYKYTRHPMMFSVLIVFWSTPTMTCGHLLFSACFTIYIFIGTYMEERDLIRCFGEPYVTYQKHTAKIIPFLKGM